MVSETTGKTVQPIIKKRDDCPTFKQDANSDVNQTSNDPSKHRAHRQNAEQSEGPYPSNILSGQKRDIDRIVTCVEGVQTQILAMKNEIENLKAKKNLKSSGETSSGNFDFSEEIELLAENVSSISTKVNQVDGLKLELKMIKRRIQRLEDGNMSTQSTHTVTGLTQDSPRAKFARMTGSLARRPMTSGTGALHLNTEKNAIKTSTTNDAMELSAQDGESNTVGQDINSALGSSEVQLQQDSLDLSKLDAGRSATTTDTVLPHPGTILEQRGSIPETDIASPTMSASALQGLPNVAELPSRRTTLDNRAAQLRSPSGTSLNSHQVVPHSDSEDEDYDPNSNQHITPLKSLFRNNDRTRGSGRRHRRSAPVKLPTPEWEKPDWAGPTDNTIGAARGRGIMRRGVSGRNRGVEPDPKRRKTTANDMELGSNSMANDRDTASLDSEDRPFEAPVLTRRQKKILFSGRPRLNKYGHPDARFVERERDEQGRLLKPNGTIDGRTLRALKFRKDDPTAGDNPQGRSEDVNRGGTSGPEEEAAVAATPTNERIPKTKKRIQHRKD